MTKLESYFKKAREESLESEKISIYFFDREKKKLIRLYDENIFDEFRNLFLGYRFFITDSNTFDSIHIASIKKIEKRVENGRYIYCGTDIDEIVDLVRMIEQRKILDGLIEILKNKECI